MEKNMSQNFSLNEDDEYVIKIAINYARKFLKRFMVSPREIVGLGHALYALERLPKSTPGVHCEFGIWHKDGDKNFSESKYIDFTILDNSFAVSIGGSVYESSVGSDSFSDPGWLVELNGYRENGLEIYRLEEMIDDYLKVGAEITVSDESEIEWED